MRSGYALAVFLGIALLTADGRGQDGVYSNAERKEDIAANKLVASRFNELLRSELDYGVELTCDAFGCSGSSNGLEFEVGADGARVQLTYAGELAVFKDACAYLMRFLKPDLGPEMAHRIIEQAAIKKNGYSSGRREIPGVGVSIGDGIEDPLLTYCSAWIPETENESSQ